MSTNMTSDRNLDAQRVQVNVLVTESAFFGSLNSLVEYRREKEGLTKVDLAERLGKDKATVTRLTSKPSNMKISTIACLADALDAHAALIFIAKENQNIAFTGTGIAKYGLAPVSTSNVRQYEQVVALRLSRDNNWIEQLENA